MGISTSGSLSNPGPGHSQIGARAAGGLAPALVARVVALVAAEALGQARRHDGTGRVPRGLVPAAVDEPEQGVGAELLVRRQALRQVGRAQQPGPGRVRERGQEQRAAADQQHVRLGAGLLALVAPGGRQAQARHVLPVPRGLVHKDLQVRASERERARARPSSLSALARGRAVSRERAGTRPRRASRSARATRPIPRGQPGPRGRRDPSRRATRRPRSSRRRSGVRQGPPARPDRRRGRRRGRQSAYGPRSCVPQPDSMRASSPNYSFGFTPSRLKAQQAKETVKTGAAEPLSSPGPGHYQVPTTLGRVRSSVSVHTAPAPSLAGRERFGGTDNVDTKGAGPGPAAFSPTKPVRTHQPVVVLQGAAHAAPRRVSRARPLASRARAGLLRAFVPAPRAPRVLFFFSRCASARRGGRALRRGQAPRAWRVRARAVRDGQARGAQVLDGRSSCASPARPAMGAWPLPRIRRWARGARRSGPSRRTRSARAPRSRACTPSTPTTRAPARTVDGRDFPPTRPAPTGREAGVPGD